MKRLIKTATLCTTGVFIASCANTNTITEHAYTLPSETKTTAKIRVDTDALVLFYPNSSCTNEAVVGSGTAVFNKNLSDNGTKENNGKTLGMPKAFFDAVEGVPLQANTSSSELLVPSNAPLTIEYRSSEEQFRTTYFCQGAFSFIPTTNTNYELVAVLSKKTHGCNMAMFNLDARSLVPLKNATRRTCSK